jgi:hypothetical protein
MSSDVEQDDDRIRFDPGALRQLSKQQAMIWFGAGAGASLVAALASQFAGARLAGPLLALPAILIASLTLIADEDGLRAAIDDYRGAVLGGLGLVAFASSLGGCSTTCRPGWCSCSRLSYGRR